eukprot:tig00021036_g17344.t1
MVLRALSSLTGHVRRIAATDDTSARIAKPRFHSFDERSREAIARAGEDVRALLYSTCPRPLADRLLAGEALALVAGSREVGTAICLRIICSQQSAGYSGPNDGAAGLVLAREPAPERLRAADRHREALPGQMEESSFVHVWNTILLSLDRLCAERGLEGFSLAGGDTLLSLPMATRCCFQRLGRTRAVELAQDAVELVERVASFLSVPLTAKARPSLDHEGLRVRGRS